MGEGWRSVVAVWDGRTAVWVDGNLATSTKENHVLLALILVIVLFAILGGVFVAKVLWLLLLAALILFLFRVAAGR